MKTHTFSAIVPVTAGNIADLMITALEGGSSYWLAAIRVVGQGTDTDPQQPGFWNDPDNNAGFLKDESYWETIAPDTHADAPLFTMVGLLSEEPEGEDVVSAVMTKRRIQDALSTYSKSGRSLEDYDAFDADYFFQHLLLGELVYG